MLTYPHINPIAISIGPIFGIGPLRVHWYGIMYLIGFVGAWWLARYRARRPGSTWVPLEIDDLIFYCAIGVIVGIGVACATAPMVVEALIELLPGFGSLVADVTVAVKVTLPSAGAV